MFNSFFECVCNMLALGFCLSVFSIGLMAVTLGVFSHEDTLKVYMIHLTIIIIAVTLFIIGAIWLIPE